jgi:hypothetical protein
LVLLVGATALMLAVVANGTGRTEPRNAEEAEERSDAVKVASPTESLVASVDAAPQGEMPDYDPPLRGSPRVLVKPGARAGRALPIPLALSPDHVAHTASPDPSLFWHIDEVPPARVKIVFTLSRKDGEEPLVETQLARVRQAGIQRIRLAEFGVKLDPEAEYEWSVALVPDSNGRSSDVFTTGYIRRVAPPAELHGELRLASVNTYASLGLWYDALEAASDAVDAAPKDFERRGQRDALLSQAGLERALD